MMNARNGGESRDIRAKKGKDICRLKKARETQISKPMQPTHEPNVTDKNNNNIHLLLKNHPQNKREQQENK